MNDPTLISSFKVRNKIGMSTLTTVIQPYIGNPSLRNQTTQRNKKYPNRQGVIKLSHFADDMILYMENPKDSTKKTARLDS